MTDLADARLLEAMRSPLVVEPAASHTCTGGAHSRLADGRIVCWSPPAHEGQTRAVDAEIAAQPVPTHLRRRWRGLWDAHDSFWSAWCATEICAKLGEVPIIVLAARGPVGASPVTIDGREVTYAVRQEGDLVVAYGVSTTTS
ncbi:MULTISPECIES: hypothetical protein [unclassified Knoellia]|uniref:hypothetical protein n=1 Tax=Knoellia altitudinis TaxID=3404795 RepID=UPI003621A360